MLFRRNYCTANDLSGYELSISVCYEYIVKNCSKNVSILEYYSDPKAELTSRLKADGYCACAHAFDPGFVEGVHKRDAEDSVYSVVVAVNLLNRVNPKRLNAIFGYLKDMIQPGGIGLLAYDTRGVAEVSLVIQRTLEPFKRFACVHNVSNNSDVYLWLLKNPMW